MNKKILRINDLHSERAKRAQNKKSEITSLYSKRAQNKRAQEEMVGFALIMVVVAVILLIFLSFILSNHKVKEIQSYEVDSFISSVLQYTSNCSDYSGKLPIRDLISKCKNNQRCLDEKESCDVLNKTLLEILSKSWKSPLVKAYELNITKENQETLIFLKKGNKTNTFKGSTPQVINQVEIEFRVYY